MVLILVLVLVLILIDQNLSIRLAGLQRLHLLLLDLPSLVVLDVPQPLLLVEPLLHLVTLEVFLPQLCELSRGGG